jgi:hypothetical protein
MVAGVVMVENRGMWCDAQDGRISGSFFFSMASILDVCQENIPILNAL